MALYVCVPKSLEVGLKIRTSKMASRRRYKIRHKSYDFRLNWSSSFPVCMDLIYIHKFVSHRSGDFRDIEAYLC